jgi:hypothetical protein
VLRPLVPSTALVRIARRIAEPEWTAIENDLCSDTVEVPGAGLSVHREDFEFSGPS